MSGPEPRNARYRASGAPEAVPELAEAVILRDLQDMDYKEIAGL